MKKQSKVKYFRYAPGDTVKPNMPQSPPAVVPRLASRHSEKNLLWHAPVLGIARTSRTFWERSVDLPEFGSLRMTASISPSDQHRNGFKAVLPHGPDNDVLHALVSIACAKGTRPGEAIHITASQLLKMAYLGKNSRSLQTLNDSIERLFYTFYSTTTWEAKGKRRELRRFKLIDGFTQVDRNQLDGNLLPVQENSSRFTTDTYLEIQLSAPVLESIQGGHIRPLNPLLLEQLSGPSSRSVYRVLSNFSEAASTITLPLHVYLLYLGLEHLPTPSKQLRSVVPPLEELRNLGFLRDFKLVDSFGVKTLTVEFNDTLVSVTPDPEVAQRLGALGISLEKSLKLALTKTTADVERACAIHASIMASSRQGISNPSGLLLNILEHPEKYPAQSVAVQAVTKSAKQAASITSDTPLVEAPSDRTFEFLTKKSSLPTSMLADLRMVYLAGEVPSSEVSALLRQGEPAVREFLAGLTRFND